MKWYDAIFEMDDCPDDHIIADNHALDKWYEGKVKEFEAYRRGEKAKRRGGKGRSAFGHDAITIYD